MGYAIKVGQWRAVDSQFDCADDEKYVEEKPNDVEIDFENNKKKLRLHIIDQETLRPLRAVYASTDTAEDHAKLAALEEEAQQLRQELSNAN